MSLVICLVHQILQPISKLRILNFHESFSRSDWRKNNNNETKKNSKTCSTFSTESKNSWKFKFVVSEWVVGSREQDYCHCLMLAVVTKLCSISCCSCSIFWNHFNRRWVWCFRALYPNPEFILICVYVIYYCYFELRLLLIHGAETLTLF